MSLDFLSTDPVRYSLGPYHATLPRGLKLDLELDGDRVVSARPVRGFFHRGLEKAMELQSWAALIAYADHLDPDTAIFPEVAAAMAVEQLASIEVPPRAVRVRVVLCELSRLSSHLLYLSRMAQASGAEAAFHYFMRDRERILDLFELLTGSRFSHGFVCFGGVRADITEGFIERVSESCDLLRSRTREHNEVMTMNSSFRERAEGSGWLSREQAIQYGASGPVARASGVALDFRRQGTPMGYEKIDFDVPHGRPDKVQRGGADVFERHLIRMREIQESIKILKQATDAFEPGPFRAQLSRGEWIPPRGEAFVRLESPRGLLACHLISDGERRPSRVDFKTASQAHLSLVPSLLVGEPLSDVAMLLASLDISMSEADR